MRYKILALDGGGLRGTIPAEIMRRTNALLPGVFAQSDLIAGTSTGGILALALAHGIPTHRLPQIYVDNAKEIFSSRGVLDAITPDELYRADFDNTGLRKVLVKYFGTACLGDLKHRVAIVTFDLDNSKEPRHWKVKVLHNFNGVGNDKDVLVVDAALRTSAAPTYFPSYQGYIDGGVAANNPSVCALAKALKEGVDLRDVSLLSLGTGFNPHRVEGDTHDWGLRQWATKLIPLLFDGIGGVADYQCAQFLGARYHRVDPLLKAVVDMSDASKVPDLLAIGGNYTLDTLVSWLQHHWLGAKS